MQLINLFLFFSLFSIDVATASDFTSQIDFAAVVKDFEEKGACVDSSNSILCRHLPWVPRIHEGVIEKNGAGFVILDSELPESSALSKWSKKFSEKDRAEMVSYFLINNPTFAAGVAKSPFTVIYLLLVKKVGDAYKIVSVSMNPASQILHEVTMQYDVVQGEINGHRGTDWIPPMSFKMGHQFKLNESL